MNDFDTVQMVALGGWLILAVSAFASYQLNWKKGLRYALIWVLIFASLAILITAVR